MINSMSQTEWWSPRSPGIKKRFYTGVGSRETPEDILNQMTWLASNLECEGFVLRSGGASGADIAFENGVINPENKKIYRPAYLKHKNLFLWNKAVDIALRNHPSPINAVKYIDYIARNAFQVLGDDLDSPSSFLVCWTRNGKDVGGTGTTIRIAKEFHVPVYNLYSINVENVFESR